MFVPYLDVMLAQLCPTPASLILKISYIYNNLDLQGRYLLETQIRHSVSLPLILIYIDKLLPQKLQNIFASS